jgi:hypothetical protein
MAGLANESRDVGTKEVLSLAQTNDKRRIAAGGDYFEGGFTIHRNQRKGSFQPGS